MPDPLLDPEAPLPGANLGAPAAAAPTPPLPEQRPPMPVQNFGQQQSDPSGQAALQSITPERAQSDPSHLLVADVLMGGALPYAQAAADVATGKIPPEQFDAARQEHERIIKALRDEHPDLVAAAEQAAPLVAGGAMAIAKPAATVAGTVGRGMAAGAGVGYVQGYTSGDTEEPSVSSKRMGQGVGRGAVTAVIGGLAAGAPDAVRGIKGAIDDRSARKAAQSVADAATAKKAASTAKGQATRAKKKIDAETAKREAEALNVRTKREAADNEKLKADAETHRAQPDQKALHPEWKNNRDIFNKDPVHVFGQMDGLNLEGFARMVNLPKFAILQKLAGKELPVDTPGRKHLMEELNEANRLWRAQRGLKPDTPAAKAPANETPAEEMTYEQLRKMEKDLDASTGYSDDPRGAAATSAPDASAPAPAGGPTATAGGAPKPARAPRKRASPEPAPTPRVSGNSADRKRRRADAYD